MSGIDGIVAEIEAKARESAAETVAAAMSERERALGEANERLENALTARKNALEREAQEVIRRRTTLAGPQARMLVLGAKQAELEKVFESARADLRAMRDYIIHTLKNPSAAQRLTAKIVESCARLKDQPRMGAALSEKTGRDTDLRYLVCGDQIAFYRVEEGKQTVSIIRILDGRTDYMRVIFQG